MRQVIENTDRRGLAAIPFLSVLSAPSVVKERTQNVAAAVDWRRINIISGQIVDAAPRVYSALGPGLLESAYRACLAYELRKRRLHVAEEVGLPVVYDSQRLDIGYRIDILVEDLVVVEVKSVAETAPIHKAQLLSYLKLSGKALGLLLNFNVVLMKNGILRMRNG